MVAEFGQVSPVGADVLRVGRPPEGSMSIASLNAQTLAIAYDAVRPGADGLVTPPPAPDAGATRVAADESTPAPGASTTLGTLVDTYL
jgi:hypothetical protein